MPLDTTKEVYSSAQSVELRAILGLALDMGASVLQRAVRNNPNITPTGTKGWIDVGILEGAIKVKDDLKTYKVEVGGITKTMAQIQIGRDAEITAAYFAPSLMGRKISTASDITIEPASPAVATTCDGTVPTDLKYNQIKVTSVTGFLPGDDILVTTGDVDFGTQEEEMIIKSIDVTNKIISFEFPLSQLPIDLAPVRKYIGYVLKRLIAPPAEFYQYRVIHYFHTNKSIEIDHYPNLQISTIIGADNSAGKKPTMFGFTGAVIATPIYDAFGKVENYSLFSTHRKF